MTVVWLTGLSGSGKSTLASAIQAGLRGITPIVVLDGDTVRDAIGDGLGFSHDERVTQIGRLARLARAIAEQGVPVVVAAVYAEPSLLAWNREHLPGYFEVYLRASMRALAARDPKRIYARAASGELRNVVGVDVPWHRPERPNLVLDMDSPRPPMELAREVVAAVPGLRVPRFPRAGRAVDAFGTAAPAEARP